MRWLVALIVAWWTVSLGAQGVAEITEFEQLFPVTKTNSGISAAGNVDFVPHGGTARDGDYPNIGLTDEILVANNGDRNVVQANTSWVNAGLVVDRGLGAVVGNGNYPTYIDANRRLRYEADYHITAASLAGQTFAVAIGLHVTAGGVRLLRLAITPDGGNWLADFSSELWNEADIDDDSASITNAALEDKRIRFQFDLTPGTMDDPGDNVEDDGTLIVSMIDLDTSVETVLYTYTSKSFYLSWIGRSLGGGSTVPANNALAVMSAGYAGLIGELERLAIISFNDMPTPGSLIDHSVPCCDSHAGGSSTGPIIPPIAPDWTPDCEGGGTVHTAAEITDDEDWADSTPPKEPDGWFTLETDPYPAVSPTEAEVIKVGTKPLSDPGRFVEARLIEVGEIQRGSSDKDGNYAPARMRIVWDDSDGRLRTMLGDPAARHLFSREGRFEFSSYAGRKAGLDPVPAIKGRLVDIQPDLNRLAVLELQDIVGSAFGLLNPDKMIGLPVGDEHENLPETSRGRIYNILFGEHSDIGALDASGNPADKGVIPVVDCGDTETETGSPSPTLVSPPRNLEGEFIGNATVGNKTNHYAIVGYTEFGHTLMSNVVEVGVPDHALDVDDYVELTWDPPLVGADFIIAYAVLGRSANPPNKRLDTMNNGGTFVNPETTYRDGRQGSRTDYDVEKSFNFKPIATAHASTDVWTWFAVALGEVEVTALYGSDIAEGDTPKRVRLTWGEGDIQAPEVRTVGGITQTGFWARGTRVQHHRDGIVTFAVNVCGYKGINTLLINQAYLMLQSFLNEFVFKNSGEGYLTGSFGPIETFSDSTPMLWTSKFQDAQDLTAEIMGNALGFIGAIGICEPTSLGEIIRRFFVTFGGHLTSDGHGRVYPYLIDPSTASPSGSPWASSVLYKERQRISALLEHRLAWNEIENRGTYSYHYDYDSSVFRNKENDFEDATSIAAHGGERLGVFQTSEKECYYGNDPATMTARWAQHLELYAYPPRYVKWATDMTALQTVNGAPVRFGHRKEGVGVLGESETPGIVMQVEIHGKEIRHLVRLLEPVLAED